MTPAHQHHFILCGSGIFLFFGVTLLKVHYLLNNQELFTQSLKSLKTVPSELPTTLPSTRLLPKKHQCGILKKCLPNRSITLMWITSEHKDLGTLNRSIQSTLLEADAGEPLQELVGKWFDFQQQRSMVQKRDNILVWLFLY